MRFFIRERLKVVILLCFFLKKHPAHFSQRLVWAYKLDAFEFLLLQNSHFPSPLYCSIFILCPDRLRKNLIKSP